MSGAFAAWQPEYAARGIATFPVREKKPAVGNYLKMGCRASAGLAARPKYAQDDAFGFVPARAHLTILDVDTPDERVLADALSERGDTPLVVRTPGGFHAYYAANGEGRSIRPDKDKPFDILGANGYAVAPPSRVAKGGYEIIVGTLDDLDQLPKMRGSVANDKAVGLVAPIQSGQPGTVAQGGRNNALWNWCMAHAKGCSTFDELLALALAENVRAMVPPLSDDEVMGRAKSAWDYTQRDKNWHGSKGHMILDAERVLELATAKPDALVLLSVLKVHHWNRSTFVVANAMAASIGMPLKRFTAARRFLVQSGELKELSAATQRKPATYSF